MPDDVIEIKTEAGTMPVHLTGLDGSAPSKLVVVYMDAAGIRDDLHDVAFRLAHAGYLAAVPDLYCYLDPDRRPDPRRLRNGDKEEFTRMMAAARSVDDHTVVADTLAMVDQLSARFPIDEGGWGCVGFCMGGRVGLRAAEASGDAMLAGAFLHPARLVTDEPDSPHRTMAGVRAELYFGFGEVDQVTPVETIPPLQEALERNHIRYRIDIFPNADHGFMMRGGPAYNRRAAERAWRGTLGLLTRALHAAG